MSDYRIKRDSMGELRVPAQALYGAQTQRAVQNFQISGLPMPREFIRALGLIKSACALMKIASGLLQAIPGFDGTDQGRRTGWRRRGGRMMVLITGNGDWRQA